MRKVYYSAAFILLTAGSMVLTGCPNNSYNPSSPTYATNTSTATPTPTGPTSTPTKTGTSTPTATVSNTPTVTSTFTVTATLTNSPTSTSTGTPTLSATDTPTATITDTPTATATATITNTPQTFTITIQNGSLGGYSGFYYSCPSGSNNTSNGLFSLSCHVNDTVNLPSGGPHTLWFDEGGSGTCISGFSGEISASTPYTFTSAGTYYFQCGVHGSCANKASCSPTNCTAMAGVITVSP